MSRLQVGFSHAPGALLRFSFDAGGSLRGRSVRGEECPARGQFFDDSQARSGATGQEAAEKWTAQGASQPGQPSVAQAPDALDVACPRLAGPEAAEAWFGDATALAAIRIEVPEQNGDIEAAAGTAYRELLHRVRGSSHPYLIRIWNYLDAINEGHGDGERYRRFCLGRAAAVDAAFNDPPPAATGIGHAHRTGVVQLIALCAAAPAIALENPRQMPAWRYPRDYGPVSPGFSRGALIGDGDAARLLASGTASIVGHRSLHEGDVRAQLREALANLDALLGEAATHGGPRFALTAPEALRVYLRAPADLAAAQDEMRAAGLPPERIVYLHGDICRRELLVELEGVFAPYPPSTHSVP